MASLLTRDVTFSSKEESIFDMQHLLPSGVSKMTNGFLQGVLIGREEDSPC